MCGDLQKAISDLERKAKQIIELRQKASAAKEAIQKQFDEIDSKIAVKFLNEKYVALKKEVEKTRALGDTEIVNACNHVIGNISEFQNELSVVYGQYLQRKSELETALEAMRDRVTRGVYSNPEDEFKDGQCKRNSLLEFLDKYGDEGEYVPEIEAALKAIQKDIEKDAFEQADSKINKLENMITEAFMSASLADLKAEYVGQSAPKIKRLFQKARANAPTILFIDEADTVFPGRDLTSGDTDSFTKDMVNQFLVEMDGVLTGESRVFVVAATNRVNVLDNAIKSRLGKPIVIPLPDKAQRKALFTKLLQKENMNFKSFHFSDEFLDKTNHMSGRDIKDFVDNMRKEAQKQTRNISDYKTEAEAKKLFYDCLRLFEEDLVRKLESSLDITINRPSDKVRYNDIIGCEEIKRAIDRQVEMFDFRARRRADEYDIKMKRGILVYGPPGNGKSQLAQAAANEHGLYFMKITSDTFTKVSLSEQNKTLVKIFNSALQLSEICGEEIKGVLLFFDEFDALASGELLDPRVRGTMLTQLDDQDTLRNPNTKVLFMAATNYYEKLDEAMIRDGRIDEKLEMRDPSPENGTQMLIQFCSQNPKVEPLDEEIAKSAYDNYANNMKEVKIRRFVASQKIILSLTGYDDQKLEKAAELRFENERPSGADLRNYANNLISTAYYRNSFTKDMKLHITEDVVKDVIATYYDKVSHEE